METESKDTQEQVIAPRAPADVAASAVNDEKHVDAAGLSSTERAVEQQRPEATTTTLESIEGAGDKDVQGPRAESVDGIEVGAAVEVKEDQAAQLVEESSVARATEEAGVERSIADTPPMQGPAASVDVGTGEAVQPVEAPVEAMEAHVESMEAINELEQVETALKPAEQVAVGEPNLEQAPHTGAVPVEMTEDAATPSVAASSQGAAIETVAGGGGGGGAVDADGDSSTAATSGLGLLAQYDSDAITDSEDDVVEVPLTASAYRSKVVDVASDTSSSSSDSDSDVEYLATLRKAIDKRIGPSDDVDDGDDDDDEDGDGKTRKKRQPPKVKGEKTLDDLPPIQDLHITVPEEECIQLGRIHSVVDQLVLVSVLPNSVLLDLDTVLFLDKGKRVLGEVFDVLGQVADPLYCVRFNTNSQIQDKGISVGEVVYVAPKTEYTQFVILSNLMSMRGSDASWENDVEPPPRYLDYSDDEEEREARTRLRNKNRPTDHSDAAKRPRPDASEQPHGQPRTAAASYQRGGPPQRQRHQAQGYNSNSNSNSNSNCNPNSNYNGGSWHSNYYGQAQRRGPPGHNYRMPPAPQHYQQQHGAPHMYAGPAQGQFNPYSVPPLPSLHQQQHHQQHQQQHHQQHQQQHHQQQDGDAPLYVPNPYAMRPPILPAGPPPYPSGYGAQPPGGQ